MERRQRQPRNGNYIEVTDVAKGRTHADRQRLLVKVQREFAHIYPGTTFSEDTSMNQQNYLRVYSRENTGVTINDAQVAVLSTYFPGILFSTTARGMEFDIPLDSLSESPLDLESSSSSKKSSKALDLLVLFIILYAMSVCVQIIYKYFTNSTQ
jgi:hypothetical protein